MGIRWKKRISENNTNLPAQDEHSTIFRKISNCPEHQCRGWNSFQAAALLVPLYYVNIYSGLALILGEVSVFIVMVIKRTTMEQAAFKMDRFGFEERIATAYENLDKEGTLVGLQREDAMKALQAHRDRIRISIWPSWKKAILCFSLLILLVGLSLIPSVAKDRAKELYSLKGEVKEKKKKLRRCWKHWNSYSKKN